MKTMIVAWFDFLRSSIFNEKDIKGTVDVYMYCMLTKVT